MPYIHQGIRERLDEGINSLIGSLRLFNVVSEGSAPEIPGILNYIITKVCLYWLSQGEEKYTQYNAVIGVLESVKMELYRRKIADYEDEKCKENGDVYGNETK
jgi:hypothetical protein